MHTVLIAFMEAFPDAEIITDRAPIMDSCPATSIAGVECLQIIERGRLFLESWQRVHGLQRSLVIEAMVSGACVALISK